MSDRDYRLSKNVRPARYQLTIDVDLDAWRFRGTEEIEVAIDQATSTIDLHAVELEVPEASISLPGGGEQAARLAFNQEAETVRLSFAEPVPAGTAKLRIAFAADIRAGLRGFYRSQKDGLRYAATQFEAADARRAFPCFDEPEFKARFALTLEVPPNVEAIANGAIEEEDTLASGRRRIRFAETPPISSYLVAYTVGPYEATPVVSTPSRVPVRVFLPRGMAAKGIFARDAHARSLTYLEDYTAIPYPYGKVDAIGIPDFEAGAMENPGAITYRLTAIAADAERSSATALKNIFYTAAHELTHMWWGDLVTMAWWDDLWLNESFATFIGYKVVADLMPEWGMWRDFVATLGRPFNLDALVSTHPISFEVKNAKQATERFDVITYWKGAGVVRMIEGFLGTDDFRTGVRAYLNRYKESNATADDFWRELSDASGRDVGTIANAWIRQPGHPMVDIATKSEEGALVLALRQERFYADPHVRDSSPPQPCWPIPMVIKYGTADGTVREERLVLDQERGTVRLPEARWFYPNGDGAGFYRFALDDRAIASLSETLQDALNAQERLDLIGNQWALVKAGAADVGQFFRLLDGFRTESDRAVVAAITDRLSWLEAHALDETARPRFERFVADFYAPQLEELGWDSSPTDSTDDRIRRATVIGALGQLACLSDVGAEARTRLEKYFRDPASLDPNMASVVVGIGARGGDQELYDRYLERKRSAAGDPEEEQRFLFGLTAFEDENLIRRTLDLSLTDDVRPQDRAHLLARLLGSSRSRTAGWSFVRDRWADITRSMDPMLQQNVVRGLAQLTPEPIAKEVCAFLPRHATDETQETVAQALEQLTIDVAACMRMTAEVSRSLERQS